MRKLIRIAVALMAVIPAVSGRLNVARVPLSFEANQGQTDRAVKFLSRDGGYALFLTPAEAVFKLRKATPPDKKPAVLRMRLVGADGTAKLSGTGQYAGTTNYFIGNDPNKWLTHVPACAAVEYKAIYPGVDLIYYGNQRQLEYDFVVSPGTDPRRVTLGFEGAEQRRFLR